MTDLLLGAILISQLALVWAIRINNKRQDKIMATLADLQAKVTAEDTVIDSAIEFIQGLAAQIAALEPNQAAIDRTVMERQRAAAGILLELGVLGPRRDEDRKCCQYFGVDRHLLRPGRGARGERRLNRRQARD